MIGTIKKQGSQTRINLLKKPLKIWSKWELGGMSPQL